MPPPGSYANRSLQPSAGTEQNELFYDENLQTVGLRRFFSVRKPSGSGIFFGSGGGDLSDSGLQLTRVTRVGKREEEKSSFDFRKFDIFPIFFERQAERSTSLNFNFSSIQATVGSFFSPPRDPLITFFATFFRRLGYIIVIFIPVYYTKKNEFLISFHLKRVSCVK